MKTYRAKTKVYSTIIKRNGQDARIGFQSGERDSGAYYTTSDPEVIKGLEASPMFGKSFVLEREIVEKPVPKAKPTNPAPTEESTQTEAETPQPTPQSVEETIPVVEPKTTKPKGRTKKS